MMASFLGGEENVITEVVHCEVTLKETALPFGEVTDGILVLRAPLIQLTMLEDPNLSHNQAEGTKRADGMGTADLLDAEADTLETEAWVIPTIHEDSEEEVDLSRACAIPIRRVRFEGDDYSAFWGLVVVPACGGSVSQPGNGKTTYRRVGPLVQGSARERGRHGPGIRFAYIASANAGAQDQVPAGLRSGPVLHPPLPLTTTTSRRSVIIPGLPPRGGILRGLIYPD